MEDRKQAEASSQQEGKTEQVTSPDIEKQLDDLESKYLDQLAKLEAETEKSSSIDDYLRTPPIKEVEEDEDDVLAQVKKLRQEISELKKLQQQEQELRQFQEKVTNAEKMITSVIEQAEKNYPYFNKERFFTYLLAVPNLETMSIEEFQKLLVNTAKLSAIAEQKYRQKIITEYTEQKKNIAEKTKSEKTTASISGVTQTTPIPSFEDNSALQQSLKILREATK